LGGPIAARRLVRRVVRIYRGFPTGEPELYDSLGQRLTMHFARPTTIMLDGDILDPIEHCQVDVPFRVTLVCG
jgi:hypothetical protein